MDSFNWRGFLTEWSHELLQIPEVIEDLGLPPDVVESGWLGYAGATEAQIAQAETRLGTNLPTSYREFLKVTNGWRQTTPFIERIWSTDDIEWFSARHQDWIDTWVDASRVYQNPPITDEEYLVYGRNQPLRVEYLQTSLEISDVGDSSIYLLNPQIVTPDGEWEAWFFANWIPGADRHRSFIEMMQTEYQVFLQSKKDYWNVEDE